MKFRDIPKFTRPGSYQVNMPLKYFVAWVKENQAENNLQLNPDFQRGHIWSEKQQIAYIEFLLRGGKSGRVIYFNCPGWRMGNRPDDFVCVDGLQRTTAIMRFIDNEIPAFGVYYKDYEDEPHTDIDVLVNINELQTRKEVLKWYIEMNDGGTPHTEEEINRVKAMFNSCDK